MSCASLCYGLALTCLSGAITISGTSSSSSGIFTSITIPSITRALLLLLPTNGYFSLPLPSSLSHPTLSPCSSIVLYFLSSRFLQFRSKDDESMGTIMINSNSHINTGGPIRANSPSTGDPPATTCEPGPAVGHLLLLLLWLRRVPTLGIRDTPHQRPQSHHQLFLPALLPPRCIHHLQTISHWVLLQAVGPARRQHVRQGMFLLSVCSRQGPALQGALGKGGQA